MILLYGERPAANTVTRNSASLSKDRLHIAFVWYYNRFSPESQARELVFIDPKPSSVPRRQHSAFRNKTVPIVESVCMDKCSLIIGTEDGQFRQVQPFTPPVFLSYRHLKSEYSAYCCIPALVILNNNYLYHLLYLWIVYHIFI